MTGCRVRVCDDCCCGTSRKHPGVDHAALRDRLSRGVSGHAQVSTSTCLLACDDSDVVVVSPDAASRAAGARPVWLGRVLDDATVDEVAAWVRSGGPGRSPLPAGLASHVVAAPRFTDLLDEAVR